MKNHNYQIDLYWTGNIGQGTQSYMSYKRKYTVRVKGKPDFIGSSDPAFRGDSSKHNPEELFLMALSSCHMLWYLHLCSTNQITVVEYKDPAEGIMLEEQSGAGRFTSVILKPTVVIREKEKLELAEKLHHEANKMCFIANSCNFMIQHEPRIILG